MAPPLKPSTHMEFYQHPNGTLERVTFDNLLRLRMRDAELAETRKAVKENLARVTREAEAQKQQQSSKTSKSSKSPKDSPPQYYRDGEVRIPLYNKTGSKRSAARLAKNLVAKNSADALRDMVVELAGETKARLFDVQNASKRDIADWIEKVESRALKRNPRSELPEEAFLEVPPPFVEEEEEEREEEEQEEGNEAADENAAEHPGAVNERVDSPHEAPKRASPVRRAKPDYEIEFNFSEKPPELSARKSAPSPSSLSGPKKPISLSAFLAGKDKSPAPQQNGDNAMTAAKDNDTHPDLSLSTPPPPPPKVPKKATTTATKTTLGKRKYPPKPDNNKKPSASECPVPKRAKKATKPRKVDTCAKAKKNVVDSKRDGGDEKGQQVPPPAAAPAPPSPHPLPPMSPPKHIETAAPPPEIPNDFGPPDEEDQMFLDAFQVAWGMESAQGTENVPGELREGDDDLESLFGGEEEPAAAAACGPEELSWEEDLESLFGGGEEPVAAVEEVEDDTDSLFGGDEPAAPAPSDDDEDDNNDLAAALEAAFMEEEEEEEEDEDQTHSSSTPHLTFSPPSPSSTNPSTPPSLTSTLYSYLSKFSHLTPASYTGRPYCHPGEHGYDFENHRFFFEGDPGLITGEGHQVDPRDRERLGEREFRRKYWGSAGAGQWECGCPRRGYGDGMAGWQEGDSEEE